MYCKYVDTIKGMIIFANCNSWHVLAFGATSMPFSIVVGSVLLLADTAPVLEL